jgi:outer membrane biosynthesis protein TonB
MNIVESTHREFGYAALGAFVQWKFEPAQFRGRAVPARLRYRVSFQASEIDAETMRMAVGLRNGNLPELVSVREIDRQPRAAKVFYPPKFVSDDETPQRHKVRVSLLVTPEGNPLFPQVESAPDPIAGYIALSAVQYWKFTPAMKKRKPVLVQLSFPIAF